MADIRTLDMKLVDDVFAMDGGYPLDFVNRTFAAFFAEELNIDIYDPRYAVQGTSKANRLRSLLRQADLPDALRVLDALWAYRQRILSDGLWKSPSPANAEGRFLEFMKRLRSFGGKGQTAPSPPASATTAPAPAFDKTRLGTLKAELIALQSLAPQSRGYAFETFLKGMFDAHGLQAREPFRNTGEQIDGSFVHKDHVYLVEAKWQNARAAADALHTFHGKLSQKATWTRGLFISHSGFTEVGLDAFGRGKNMVCMEGLDLWELLDREIPFDDVLDLKVRRAAETGLPFIPVRDLFPK